MYYSKNVNHDTFLHRFLEQYISIVSDANRVIFLRYLCPLQFKTSYRISQQLDMEGKKYQKKFVIQKK
jgi:hypothetical protein